MFNVEKLLFDSYAGDSTETVKSAEEGLKSLGSSSEVCKLFIDTAINQENDINLRLASILQLHRLTNQNWNTDMPNESKILLLNSFSTLILSFEEYQNNIFDFIKDYIKLSMLDNAFDYVYEYFSGLFETNLLSYLYFAKSIASIYNYNGFQPNQSIKQDIITRILSIIEENTDFTQIRLCLQTVRYIFMNNVAFEIDLGPLITKLNEIFSDYSKIPTKTLSSAISTFCYLFHEIDIEVSCLLSKEILPILGNSQIPNNIQAKLGLFINSIVINPATYESLVVPNFNFIFENIIRIYFMPMDADMQDFELNPISFISSYKDIAFAYDSSKSYLFMTFQQAGRDNNQFPIIVFNFIKEMISKDINERELFGLIYFFSSIARYLTDNESEVFELLSILLGVDNPLITVGNCILISQMNFDSFPEEIYDILFEYLFNDIVLIRYYAIDALSEIISSNVDEDLQNSLEEKYSENAEDIINELMNTVDVLNDQSLMISCEKIISFFKSYVNSNSSSICSRLFILYMNASTDEESFVDCTSILSTITYFLKTNADSIVEELSQLIFESLEHINCNNINSLLILISNIIYYMPNEVKVGIQYIEQLILAVDTYKTSFEALSILLFNLILKNKSWAIENKSSLYELALKYIQSYSSDFLTEDLSHSLRILSAILKIDEEIDVSQFNDIVNTEQLGLMIQARLEGAQSFISIMIVKTSGKFLENFEILEIFDSIVTYFNQNLIKGLMNSVTCYFDADQMNEFQEALDQIYEDETVSGVLEQPIISLF
ncbi:hypothetical protein TVAG_366650 [Trichomonas vaginalis G3]|uniref:Importin N-terminal domain-containing protein n=1 Tax=Trichomonas vaginalis (strain ATCC PRA-98 / G3) TaxID=412133 RepID=A2FWF8_TRIV3|nr:importin-7, 8, 11 family [Trichomonas vaginalis G3]EAX90757.1 hypothetical protein TVAG_366650 [Trichomonas vaginalis G3]KAI5515824.1 importin-7, 8, 11 family [Trichomonas vaginalis G3]|eukprot:XP_001303687.1 hypothetical protein [Trichomonas vaginalis G3]